MGAGILRGLVFRTFDDFKKRDDLDRAGIPVACPFAVESVVDGTLLISKPEEAQERDISGPG